METVAPEPLLLEQVARRQSCDLRLTTTRSRSSGISLEDSLLLQPHLDLQFSKCPPLPASPLTVSSGAEREGDNGGPIPGLRGLGRASASARGLQLAALPLP